MIFIAAFNKTVLDVYFTLLHANSWLFLAEVCSLICFLHTWLYIDAIQVKINGVNNKEWPITFIFVTPLFKILHTGLYGMARCTAWETARRPRAILCTCVSIHTRYVYHMQEWIPAEFVGSWKDWGCMAMSYWASFHIQFGFLRFLESVNTRLLCCHPGLISARPSRIMSWAWGCNPQTLQVWMFLAGLPPVHMSHHHIMWKFLAMATSTPMLYSSW